MGVEERSLRVYDTRKTFFSKIGNTFSKFLTPTQVGINSWLLSMKRSAIIKNCKALQSASGDKKEKLEEKFDESYTLYLSSIDQLIIDTIYKKVKIGSASEYEKDALSNYYNVIRLKDIDELEYKYRKQQYLMNVDFKSLKATGKNKTYDSFKPVYIMKMEQIYKGLLKHYSVKISEKLSPMQKEEAYDKVFDILEEYVTNIIPLKNIEDEELVKECSLFETYEVGKLDQVDILDKRMILLGISRKLFVHSLPLVAAEKCYIKLLKDTRNLIVDTKIARKRESAYQLMFRLIDQYNQKLLAVKIFWNKPEDRANYLEFSAKNKLLEEQKSKMDPHVYEVNKQILYISSDMRELKKYKQKYYRIMKFYRARLVKLGVMRKLKNTYKTGNYSVVKGYKRIIENEAAC